MTQSFRHVMMVSLVILILSLSLGFQPTRADTPSLFYVDSYEDINDFVTNSVCSVGAVTGGPCTLRAAIAEANAIIDTFDIVIDIPSGNYVLSIPPEGVNDITSGDLNFIGHVNLHSITLRCSDPQPAVIDAKLLDRVLRIEPDAIVYLENIVVRGGLLSWTGSVDMFDGAGILNYGTSSLTNVVVENNEARCGQETCTFYISGGGILNAGQMTIVDSMIRNNKSVGASAIANAGGSFGVVIKNSTIYGNHASGAFTIDSFAYLHIRNSTISGNTAPPGYISGIANHDMLVLESTTVANAGRSSSIFNYVSGSVRVKDSILQNDGASGSRNCENNGTWNSEGYSIYSDDTCPSTGTDLVNTDALLGALGDWGGSTLTMPLQTGSPAEDHRPGECMTIPEGPTLPPMPLTEDQRHYLRDDGACDTGAFEGILDVIPVYLPLIIK
jgi:CSLREA domain-containing protein